MKREWKNIKGHRVLSLVYTKGDNVFVLSGKHKNAFFVVNREGEQGSYWCKPLNEFEAQKVGLKSFDEVPILWNEMEQAIKV